MFFAKLDDFYAAICSRKKEWESIEEVDGFGIYARLEQEVESISKAVFKGKYSFKAGGVVVKERCRVGHYSHTIYENPELCGRLRQEMEPHVSHLTSEISDFRFQEVEG